MPCSGVAHSAQPGLPAGEKTAPQPSQARAATASPCAAFGPATRH